MIAGRRIDQLSAEGGTAMKLVTAIIRPDRLDEQVPVLIADRDRGLTVTGSGFRTAVRSLSMPTASLRARRER